ncbi:MAG: helicase-related protein [Bacteroidota bacterium]
MIRDLFNHRIQKGLIGPGSENWGLNNEEEIISDYPLVRYFSGILFPEKETPKSEKEEDDLQAESETEEPNLLINDDEQEDFAISEKETKVKAGIESEIGNKANQNHFNPNNIGITFCLDKGVKTVEITFSGGFYYVPPQSEIKIKIPDAGYDAFMDAKLDFPFKNILHYEDGFLSLTRELKGDKGGRNKRSGDYLWFDDFKKANNYKDSSAKYYIHYFERLIGRTWKRISFSETLSVKIEDTNKPEVIPISNAIHKDVLIGYNLKTYESKKAKGRLYIKVQLVNLSKQSSRRFTNKTPELNQKCLFQSAIKISSSEILPFKSNQELNPFDHEAEELNLLYRNVKSYGIGHNCSVDWLSEPNLLKTTFLPEYNIRDTKNDFQEADFQNKADFQKLDKALGIKELSIFSNLKRDEIKASLFEFIELYSSWITTQKDEQQKLSESQKNISKDIITNLDKNHKRLKDNIDSLNDEIVFRAFQLANTAMLIQIIISNDKHFSKTEKNVSEINDLTEYNSLAFFEKYDYSRLEKGRPQYRPFQLAFLLLSLKGIIDPSSKDRKEIVDLIWFPTGGGKTEAYLAVTAFTIAYRRLTNDEKKSTGVSVIMRYTLRLLTAQQFERSSRLISALEFLRKNFTEELKKEPISIGLWVGNEITPGTIEKALDKVEDIEKECQKDNGQPDSRNPFQISACPWCGTKLISKNDYGFREIKKEFIIQCLNTRCTFHNGIPVQVVDEMLFKHPPTLLFATVDKFAQIAWKEDAHNFFNSLNTDKLPPDLIIQDEMHLLSGPLGSIVGIFESIVEKLCTNEGQNLTPKIIASTATTRNTKQQVEQLYGDREVNVFPPSGISYDDRFFARESKENSRRKYIGFMAVGKTSIDTQLHIIAHLLVSRIESGEPIDDNYWTIVSYYNSLKDVGKIRNKIGDEVLYNTKQLQARVLGNNSYSYNHFGLEDRTEELTARVDSSKIKSVLKQLENSFEFVDRISKSGEKYKSVNSSVIDLVLATNMFSVGIDISRLNVMLMNGMPKNVAEYIQASSRVGRKSDGLVVAFLDPNRARDKSYFEHFVPFHQAFYKNIEPLSVTPFTENTIDKMLGTAMIAYLRHKVPRLNKDKSAQYFRKEDINDLKLFLNNRFGKNVSEYNFFESKINFLADDWEARIGKGLKDYSELMKRSTETGISEKNDWIIMQSMREVDADTYIEIKQTFSANLNQTQD